MVDPSIKELTKSFKSKTKNNRERYNEFLYHCWIVFEKKIKSNKSDKNKNKYSIMRDNTLKYLIANETAVTLELSK